MKRVLFATALTLSLALAGCTTAKVKKRPGPHQRIYSASYDQTWRAAQLALKGYPMRINDMDLGILETEFIKGFDGFVPPYTDRGKTSGMRYKLSLKVVKGRSRAEPAVKVTVFKRMELMRDFFSEPEKRQSDGLEEMAILYRIQRELNIDRALSRIQESSM